MRGRQTQARASNGEEFSVWRLVQNAESCADGGDNEDPEKESDEGGKRRTIGETEELRGGG